MAGRDRWPWIIEELTDVATVILPAEARVIAGVASYIKAVSPIRSDDRRAGRRADALYAPFTG
jgi:hypothetical protein